MRYKAYLIDLDGTIYKGNEAIPEGKAFVEDLQKRNIPYLFMTNNTTRTPHEVQKKLAKTCSIETPIESIYTASLATVDYMKEKQLGQRVVVIGESGLRSAIKQAGFTIVADRADYVVVGLDQNVTYEQFALATLAVQKGAHFIGTNPDLNIPTEKGLLPGAGSLIALIKASTQTKPTIIGKPETIMMEKALNHLNLSAHEVVMVGDNYLTDIQFGINSGVDTLLVTTGFTKPNEVPHLPIAPTYVISRLSEWRLDA